MAGFTRARRFPLRRALLFRAGAGEPWRRARTIEISGDRVSFVARNKLLIGARLDMRFFVGDAPVTAEVACRGRVVRQKSRARHSGAATYAATIDSYRLNP